MEMTPVANRITNCKKTGPATAEHIGKLYSTMSLQEISALTGLSVSTVGERVAAAGVPKRPRGGIPGRFKRPGVSIKDLVAAFDAQTKKNYTELGKRFGLWRPAVVYRLEKVSGRKLPKKKRRTELPADKIVSLYVDEPKLSVEVIAKRFSAGTNTICRLLRERGVSLRSRGANTKALWAQRKATLAALQEAAARLGEFQQAAAKALPADFMDKKDWHYWAIGLAMLSLHDPYDNAELGEALDEARVPPQPGYKKNWNGWSRALSYKGGDHAVTALATRVRNWLRDAGKLPDAGIGLASAS